ncbi:hypothetical protein PC110_g4861 [Phytophthora cactorum]|uniref:MULE transposase domain-containing protein n=1 Tax=Phytophthora cactorum TaxID=29920 RepID=A0A329SQE8_9STRA|nr:hypothetical protein PC110_g4861 [Phytophthora cactorum]
MRLAHDHYRHTGFHVDTFVESNMSEDATRQRQRDVSFTTLQGVLEREMLPAYSGAWIDVTGKPITDFLLSKGYTVNQQTISQLKLRLLDAHQGDMMERYQKLESYLALVAKSHSYSHYGFEKTESGVFLRACFFPGAFLLAKRHCKHVIGLDGTHLKGDMNKRGVYLLAASKDYNNRILIFGLALVEKDDTSNWRWFLEHMKAAVASASSDWDPIFVTDRQKGIIAAVTELYPNRGHRFCV